MTPAAAHSLAVAAAAVPSAAPGAFDLLRDLSVILCVAALTTLLFQRIKQPVVLGYLLAGLIVGPHLPIPLFADARVAHTLSELGVILLMFSLGMEFSLRKLARVAPTAGIVALIECSLMIWLGYTAARLFGWTGYEALFTGALVAISSTTIIVKAFAEQKTEGPLKELVLGILIAEDLIAILLVAIVTAAASGAGLSAGALAVTIGKLLGFLVALLVVGMLIVPRLVRFIVKLGRPETTVVASIGICFASALLARTFGFSVALGAFLGGALVAESGVTKTVEHLVEPVRDVFAAVFFVSVGMLIDPVLVAEHWVAVVVLTLVVVGGKLIGVSVGAFIAGNGVRSSVQAGLSLAQIGEFSFIIAGVGLQLGVTRHFLYPVAVAVSALTTLTTPWLIRASDSVASRIDDWLPHPLQTHAALYASWVRQLRSTPEHVTAWANIRRLVSLLFLDMAIIAAIVVGVSVGRHRILHLLEEETFVRHELARGLLLGATMLVLLPFVLGAVRIARALGLALAAEALPSSGAGLDLAAAPRRALLVSLQIAILIIAGIPLVAITQPFLPSFPAIGVLLLGLLALVVPLWRSASNLQGHVRAGAQVILEALASQSAVPAAARASSSSASISQWRLDLGKLVPGLGDATTVRLSGQSSAVGRSLKEINLRGETGATVIAIHRPRKGVLYPTADEILEDSDTLVLTGTEDSVASATRMLHHGELTAAPEGTTI